MTFCTHIEYLDHQTYDLTGRHMIRCDGQAQVYRIIHEVKDDFTDKITIIEETIPYCVVKSQTTWIKE